MSACVRCGRSLCHAHVPYSGRRCEPCELEYLDRRLRLPLGRWFVMGLIAAWAAFVLLIGPVNEVYPDGAGVTRGFTTGYPIIDLAFMFVLVSLFTGQCAVALRRWHHRRCFLRERL